MKNTKTFKVKLTLLMNVKAKNLVEVGEVLHNMDWRFVDRRDFPKDEKELETNLLDWEHRGSEDLTKEEEKEREKDIDWLIIENEARKAKEKSK